MRSFANFAGFQLAWLASVLGAAHGAAWIGVVACTAFVAIQWIASSQRRLDARLVAWALLLGILLDGVLGQLGWIVYRGGEGAPVPAWIVALWSAFAMTLTHSLAWLRPGAAILLGAVGGPVAYLGAARLGAVELIDPTRATIALAIGWAVATRVLTLVVRHAHGATPVPPLAMGGSR